MPRLVPQPQRVGCTPIGAAPPMCARVFAKLDENAVQDLHAVKAEGLADRDCRLVRAPSLRQLAQVPASAPRQGQLRLGLLRQRHVNDCRFAATRNRLLGWARVGRAPDQPICVRRLAAIGSAPFFGVQQAKGLQHLHFALDRSNADAEALCQLPIAREGRAARIGERRDRQQDQLQPGRRRDIARPRNPLSRSCRAARRHPTARLCRR